VSWSRWVATAVAVASSTSWRTGPGGWPRTSRAAATWRAYDSDLRHFRAWRAERQLEALPAEPLTVASYLAAAQETSGPPPPASASELGASAVDRRLPTRGADHRRTHVTRARQGSLRDRSYGRVPPPDEQLARVEAAVDELQESLNGPQPEPGVIRRAGQAVLDALPDALASVAIETPHDLRWATRRR